MEKNDWDHGRRTALLATVGLFRSLPVPALAALATRFYPRPARRDEILFLEGDSAVAIHVLAEGQVKMIRETEEGREVILRLLHPGEIFGGAGGWGEERYPATAVALEDAVILRLPAAEFEALMYEQPAVAVALVRELARRLREAEARIRELQTERVERRIARAILRLANRAGTRTSEGIELDVPLSRQNLAELCGTTLSTASRVLSAWQRQGLIAGGREQIVILRPHALVAIAEELETELDETR